MNRISFIILLAFSFIINKAECQNMIAKDLRFDLHQISTIKDMGNNTMLVSILHTTDFDPLSKTFYNKCARNCIFKLDYSGILIDSIILLNNEYCNSHISDIAKIHLDTVVCVNYIFSKTDSVSYLQLIRLSLNNLAIVDIQKFKMNLPFKYIYEPNAIYNHFGINLLNTTTFEISGYSVLNSAIILKNGNVADDTGMVYFFKYNVKENSFYDTTFQRFIISGAYHTEQYSVNLSNSKNNDKYLMVNSSLGDRILFDSNFRFVSYLHKDTALVNPMPNSVNRSTINNSIHISNKNVVGGMVHQWDGRIFQTNYFYNVERNYLRFIEFDDTHLEYIRHIDVRIPYAADTTHIDTFKFDTLIFPFIGTRLKDPVRNAFQYNHSNNRFYFFYEDTYRDDLHISIVILDTMYNVLSYSIYEDIFKEPYSNSALFTGIEVLSDGGCLVYGHHTDMSFSQYATYFILRFDSNAIMTHVNGKPTGNALDKIVVYPNPAGEWVRFKNLSHKTGYQIALYDMQGKLIGSSEINQMDSRVKLPQDSNRLIIYKITNKETGQTTQGKIIKTE